jgi:hypothetical protein
VAAAVVNTFSHHANFTAVRFDQPDDRFEQSSLPTAVRTDQPNEIGLVDREIDILKDGMAFITSP